MFSETFKQKLDTLTPDQLMQMETTKISNQGQVTIPQFLREECHWEDGQELMIY